MSKENFDDERTALTSADLTELRRTFRAIVDLRDRHYGFPAKNYTSCFVGQEAVAQLIKSGLAADVDDSISSCSAGACL